MPGLLTLQTDLKSLKYGQDRPNSGNSGQPYIQTDINSVDATFNRVRLTNFDDGFIRGGAVASQNASAVDTLRIGKFLTDPPKGPLFLARQVGLQLSNPQLEHIDDLPTNRTGTNRPTKGQGFFKNVGNAVTNGATSVGAFIANTANRIENEVGPTRIYNLGINTLAQVSVNAIGGHIVRHGFLPVEDPSKYYEAVVTQNNFENNSNRLEQYASNFSLGGMDSIINKINYNTDTEITSYVGGPSSVYGVGRTFIRRYTNTNDKFKIDGALATSKALAGRTRGDNNDAEDIAFGLDRLLGLSNLTGSILSVSGSSTPPLANNDDNIPVNLNTRYSTANTNIADDKSGLYHALLPEPKNINDTNPSNGPSTYPKTNANDVTNKDGVLELPALVFDWTNPAVRTYTEAKTRIDSFTTNKRLSRTNDMVSRNPRDANNQPTFQYNTGAKLAFNRTVDRVVKNDTLALKFTPLDPFTGGALNGAPFSFLGYITDYTDNFDSTWSDVKYVGRAEKFYIFNEFKRSISLGFNIPCFNRKELSDKHKRLNRLASILAGKYNDNLLGGIITKLQVGNYIDNQPGIINSLNFSPIEDSSWDLQAKLAFYIKVSLNFTVIHNQLPQYDGDDNDIFITVPNVPDAADDKGNTGQGITEGNKFIIGDTISYPENTFGGTKPAGF
jgi:hypothetical protein